MGLQVWLPLTGDLHNQGLKNISVSSNNSSVSTNGKIGSCMKITSNTDLGYSHDFNTTGVSFGGWFKFNKSEISSVVSNLTYNSTANSPTGNLIGNNYYGGIGLIWTGNNYYSSNNFSSMMIQSILRTSSTIQNTSGFYVDFDVWIHIFLTWDPDAHALNLYKNGILFNTKTSVEFSDGVTKNILLNYNAIWGGNGPSASIPMYCNDIRIYDHALSPLEVKRLAQGLVLHYPLNRGGLGPSNLLKNGFGELGSENWSNSNISTDVPSGHSEIKKSYRDNESLEFIPLLRNCTYKFSYWVKAAYSSGYSYPSLKPYDADKLFINTNNCREGFSLSTMTALKKQLNPGDTKIYVDDLSAWNANSGHYYDTVAIFSYTDGQGYTWPDGTYTRNCPAFSSDTEAKTNLDKTNNIITLLSAYTGPTMPIGTKVCASTYGSTYFYPSGGINNSTIVDWTYKESAFSSQHSRLECAKYIKVYAYSSCYQAGMILSNLTLEDMDNNIEYDCSGYCNNGTRVGTFSWSGDTPRYGVSVQFNGTQYIQLPFPCGTISEAVTVVCWGYESDWNTTYAERLIGAATGSSGWCIGDYGSENTLFAFYANGSYNDASGFKQLSNGWHHFVITFDGFNLKYYVDGGLFSSKTFSTKQSATGVYNIQIGQHYGGACNFKGKISDVRIYATALSADDVMALYHTPISLANNGALLTQGEYVES